MHLVQKSLTEVANEWNSHRIRPSRNTCDPAGIPDQLFYMPASLGTLMNIHNFVSSMSKNYLLTQKLQLSFMS